MERTSFVGIMIAALVLSGAAASAEETRPIVRAQDAAVARTGSIQGLGAVSAQIGWDGRQQIVLHAPLFEVARAHDPATRETTIVIRGEDETAVTITLGGPNGFSIQRGLRRVEGMSDETAIRSLLTGRAVAAARGRLGAFERRLSEGAAARIDDPHAYGFLLVGALLSSLHGDPAALGRARDLMLKRARGKLQAARFDFKNCVADYERYLVKLDTDRTNCLEAANSQDYWYERAAQRLLCEAEFMAGALAGEGQFVACTSLGAIL